MYDVIVIGAGPVGSHTANRLVMAGYKVAVIEQKESLDTPVCCTGIISEECARSYKIDERVIFSHVSGATVWSPSGKKLQLARPFPQAVILNRPQFNVFMAARAKSNGAEYYTGNHVTGAVIETKFARVRAESRGGEKFYEARALVIATGSLSHLTELLGLRKPGFPAAGAQAEVPVNGISGVEVYLGNKYSPGFFSWIVPTTSNRALVGLLAKRNAKEYLNNFISWMSYEGKCELGPEHIFVGSVPLKPLARTYSDRLLVTGTAAGQVKPITGGGIYYGLLCADVAADVLIDALHRDDLSQRALSAYERKWKKVIGKEIKTGLWARRLFECLGDTQIDQIFDIILSTGLVETLLEREDVSFDWHSHVITDLLRDGTLFKLIIKR